MIGPSSTWICFIKWKLGVNGNENKIDVTLSLIIAFGPEPWSNCTLSTQQKGVGWSYCMYTTYCMMLTQSPCLCGIFLRPRSVAIAVPKIGCQDEVNSCRPLRILKNPTTKVLLGPKFSPWHIAWCPVLSSVQELNQDSSQLPKLARSQIPVCLSFLDKYVFELFCRRNEGIMVDRLTRDRGHLCSVSVATSSLGQDRKAD